MCWNPSCQLYLDEHPIKQVAKVEVLPFVKWCDYSVAKVDIYLLFSFLIITLVFSTESNRNYADSQKGG